MVRKVYEQNVGRAQRRLFIEFQAKTSARALALRECNGGLEEKEERVEVLIEILTYDGKMVQQKICVHRVYFM